MNASRDQIERASVESLSTALGVELEPCADQLPPTSELVWTRIAIEGAWTGHLLLGCAPELLEQAAHQMFGDDAEISDEDAADVALELVNIIGGNLAPLLGEACELSLPESGHGDVSPETMTTGFATEGAHLVIEIAEQTS